MGVTIHFEGNLIGESEYHTLLLLVRDFASRHEWVAEHIDEAERSLERVRDEQDWNYVGLTKGLVLYPHDDAEPMRFEFDENLCIQEYCKTQFAGPLVHVTLIDLLRLLQPLFKTLIVYDEGEYWETGDVAVLTRHMRVIDAKIAQLITEKSFRLAKVRLPSGRISDVIS